MFSVCITNGAGEGFEGSAGFVAVGAGAEAPPKEEKGLTFAAGTAGTTDGAGAGVSFGATGGIAGPAEIVSIGFGADAPVWICGENGLTGAMESKEILWGSGISSGLGE